MMTATSVGADSLMYAIAAILFVAWLLLGLWWLRSVAVARRWKALVDEELKRRNLVRDPSRKWSVDVLPADGYRVIDTCICRCRRDGQLYEVTVFNRGWSGVQLCVDEEPCE